MLRRAASASEGLKCATFGLSSTTATLFAPYTSHKQTFVASIMVRTLKTALLLGASSSALLVPGKPRTKTLRFVEVAERISTSEDKAETFETADYLQDMDRYEGKNNVIPTGFDVNAAIDAAATESTTFIDVVVEETVAKVAEERKDEVAADAVASVEKKLETKLDETMEKIEAAAVPMEEVVVGPVGEFLIKWGFKRSKIPKG